MTKLSWPDRRVMELLRLEHPIVLSPMAGIGTVELAASVCAAGGLGSIGCAGMQAAEARETLAALRSLASSPINVNFFCHAPARRDPALERAWRDRLTPYYREFGLDPTLAPAAIEFPSFDHDLCAVVEDARPEVVSFHFGLPKPQLVARVKAAGCRVMSTATTVAEARWLEERGADVIIAQGSEAGGHRGTFLLAEANGMSAQTGVFALLARIVGAVSVPVIAAGGIGDARGITAAFALGPDSTVVTNVFTGRPARGLVNRFVREMGPLADAIPAFPLPLAALAPIRAKAQERNDSDFTPFWAGQATVPLRDLSGRDLTESLASESLARFRQLA